MEVLIIPDVLQKCETIFVKGHFYSWKKQLYIYLYKIKLKG